MLQLKEKVRQRVRPGKTKERKAYIFSIRCAESKIITKLNKLCICPKNTFFPITFETFTKTASWVDIDSVYKLRN